MKRSISLFFILILLPLTSLAENLYDVKIINKTNYDATIMLGSESEKWICGDLCTTQIVPANSKKVFHTKIKDLTRFYSLGHALETINITYGDTNAKVQFWADHEHSVDTHVKTAMVCIDRPAFGKYYMWLYPVQTGVGTDSDKIHTELYTENTRYYDGNTYVTLTLT